MAYKCLPVHTPLVLWVFFLLIIIRHVYIFDVISQVVTILINACFWSDFVITQAFFSFLLHGHSVESTEGERGAHRAAAEGARPREGRGRPGRRPGRWGGQSWQYFTLHITFVKQRYWRERERKKKRITSCIRLS